MKLTKNFWKWAGQVTALFFLLVRADLIVQLLKLIPNADFSQLYPEVAIIVLIVAAWAAWLVWRAYEGFYRTMDFVIDENDHRW